jgi:hypothetical protein
VQHKFAEKCSATALDAFQVRESRMQCQISLLKRWQIVRTAAEEERRKRAVDLRLGRGIWTHTIFLVVLSVRTIFNHPGQWFRRYADRTQGDVRRRY